jgi:hypothetical protein
VHGDGSLVAVDGAAASPVIGSEIAALRGARGRRAGLCHPDAVAHQVGPEAPPTPLTACLSCAAQALGTARAQGTSSAPPGT